MEKLTLDELNKQISEKNFESLFITIDGLRIENKKSMFQCFNFDRDKVIINSTTFESIIPIMGNKPEDFEFIIQKEAENVYKVKNIFFHFEIRLQ